MNSTAIWPRQLHLLALVLIAPALIAVGCASDGAKQVSDGAKQVGDGVKQVGDGAPSPLDAKPVDAAPPDGTTERDAAAQPDATSQADSGGDARAADGGLPSTCSGACATLTVAASVGGVAGPFDGAFFGFDLDAAGKPTGIRVEAHYGGAAGCPEQGSPTPDRTLIVAGLDLPGDSSPQGYADGLRVTLLDFDGALLGTAPLAKATAATATFVASRIEGASDELFVAFDLDATLDLPSGGTVSGRIYATWCASLDAS